MAEKIVKTNNTNTRLGVLEATIAAIAMKLGISGSSESEIEDSPAKTSARIVRGNAGQANFAKRKGSAVEDVAITLTPAMIEGRMKLPARMFTKGPKCIIDGHTFTQQPADQHRSTKFNPEILVEDPEVGDTIVFEHVSGREWTVADVQAGKAPSRKAKPAGKTQKPARNAKPAKTQSSSSGKVKRTESNGTSVAAKIREFAAMCIENNDDDDFEENENIKKTGTFELDARVMLTTKQSQQFRSWRKSQGLTLKKAVALLNAEVYEEA